MRRVRRAVRPLRALPFATSRVNHRSSRRGGVAPIPAWGAATSSLRGTTPRTLFENRPPGSYRGRMRPLLLAGLLVASAAATASAQVRTWVSKDGNDADACSSSLPCKTFQGAFSKTAENGEIDAQDPAGYGTFTFNKGMTLDGTG